jgi:ATP-binding cassette subfamily B multidrug efflux pump
MTEQPSALPVTLIGQLKRQLPRYLVGIALLAVYQTAQYMFDKRLIVAINAVTGDGLRDAISSGRDLVVIAVVAFGIRIASRVAIFNAGRQAEYEIRNGLLARLQTLGPGFYQTMPPGEIMSRATNDLTQVRLLLGFAVLNAVNTTFGLVSAFAVTWSISPTLTLAALAPMPLLVLITRIFGGQIYGRQKANQDALGEMSDLLQTSITGSRVIRSFDLERAQEARFTQVNQNYLEKSLALSRLRGAIGPVMASLSGIGVIIVFWYGGHMLVTGAIDPGGFLTFFRALGRLSWPLMALGFLIGLVQRGRAAYSRLTDILKAQPDVVDGTVPAPAELRGKLEVRNLSFSYRSGSPVLKDVSFALEPGTSVAIVGRTASGKSTLARLLPRLMNTPRGSVFLDGIDICDLPLSVVRGAIGYTQQDAFLFSTTAAHNIGFALAETDSEPARETIRSAAKRAHVLDELLGLPDGLDTLVGERGVQLSGGQKQRVALASGFVLSPKLLVLDDPLSAVDARTEKGILEAIDEERAERGVILVTHRVAAARRCDRVLVLDQGRIVEAGTHDELCRQGGIYARFAEEQRIEAALQALENWTPPGLAGGENALGPSVASLEGRA